jgi:multiple sugar transport system substrate-binding protein
MCFLTLCANSGHPCATSGPQFVERETAERTFEWLREFVRYMPNHWLERNPIVVYDWLLGRGHDGFERHIYSPLIYGYVTYSLRPAQLEFGNIPGVRGSVLGGTGIAVSAYSPQRDVAVAVARDLASEATQRGIYAQAGGQPAHRAAWTDDTVNARAENFFRDTLATLDASSLRPRFDGYIAFQRQAGALVGACIEKVIPIASAVDRLNDAFARAQGL